MDCFTLAPTDSDSMCIYTDVSIQPYLYKAKMPIKKMNVPDNTPLTEEQCNSNIDCIGFIKDNDIIIMKIDFFCII